MVKKRLKHFFRKIKLKIVAGLQIWFYDVKKLPVGTHLFYFLQYRVDFEIKTVFDVGANIGKFSEEVLKFYPKSTIHCFEPVKSTFDHLKGSFSKNNKVSLNQIALGNLKRKQIIKLYDPSRSDVNSLIEKNQPANSSNSECIEIDTLDNYVETNSIDSIDFLKIDTEGYDLFVLEGSKETARKKKIKLVYVECGLDYTNEKQIHLSKFLEFLSNEGFVFIGLFQSDIRKISKKRHISNALFVHELHLNEIKTNN